MDASDLMMPGKLNNRLAMKDIHTIVQLYETRQVVEGRSALVSLETSQQKHLTLTFALC